MRRLAFTTMSLQFTTRACPRVLCFALLLAFVPAAFAADPPSPASEGAAATGAAPGDADAIVSTNPMEFEADDGGVHGQLVVASEIVSPDTRSDLVFTVTGEPLHGRVGLAGGDDADFFNNKTSHVGYFRVSAAE